MSFDTALRQGGWRSRAGLHSRDPSRGGLPKILLTILLLLSLTTTVAAQDGKTASLPSGIEQKKDDKKDDKIINATDFNAPPPPPDHEVHTAPKIEDKPTEQIVKEEQAQAEKPKPAPAGNKDEDEPPKPKEEEHHEENPDEPKDDGKFLANGKPRVKIESLNPFHGPITGGTKVVVRGGPFDTKSNSDPQCRFGDVKVGASFVPCPPRHRKVYELEGRSHERVHTCIQCEPDPAVHEKNITNVTFTISLDGTFEDVRDYKTFIYEKPIKVTGFKPEMGVKDGGTQLEVWGENFYSYDDEAYCYVGTKASRATVYNSGYLRCPTRSSDVINRPMPFHVSMNGQQMSGEHHYFWFYSPEEVTGIDPAMGPEKGGTLITMKGQGFRPFDTTKGELDVSNSTYCYFVALGQYRKAHVIDNNHATCKSPESYYFRETAVEFTLNAQDRTDDQNIFTYFRPPIVVEAVPDKGPTIGGTVVTIAGSQFPDTGNLTCRFGKTFVNATRVSSSEIRCTSPPVDKEQEVDLTIQLFAGMDSAGLGFYYYELPVVKSLSPTCGPMTGFTQLNIKGEHFRYFGRDELLCAFKQEDNSNFYLDGGAQPVVLTNATLINATMLICSSPSLANKQGYVVESDSAWFDVYVTVDGAAQLSLTNGRFEYYNDPVIQELYPALGPQYGGTLVTVNGTGFDQNTTCGIIIRLGIIELKPQNITNETMTFKAPKSPLPGTAAFSVSLNGQQFSKQRAVSDLPKEIVYDFYEPPYTTWYYPARGPNNGANFQRHQGFGFMLSRPHINDRLWVKLTHPGNSTAITEEIEIPSDNLNIDEWTWTLPPADHAGEAIMQISLNQQDWHEVISPDTGHSYLYYAAPHITSISPSFGHVKTTKDQVIEITGTGFACYDDDCSDLLCRFGNAPEEWIYVHATLASSTLIRCKVPQYTKPDVLFVEMTVNGESYTSDNKTYGYFDPFVLDAEPRLFSTDGSTHVQVKGLGFVDSGQCKASYDNRTSYLQCGGTVCAKDAKFIDKNTLNTTTFPQADVRYSSGNNVGMDPMYIDALVWGDQFTQNQVEVYYYEDPVLRSANIAESPSNIQTQILMTVDFKNNDLSRLLRVADTKCRFTANGKTYIEEGQLVAYPFTQNRDPNLINTFHCKTPRWENANDQTEQAQLDISLNGQNWFGNYAFTFARELRLHRDIPMSAPNANATQVSVIGQGFALRSRTPSIKWGLSSTEAMNMSSVRDYKYNHDAFIDSIPGSQSLKAYETEASVWPRVDSPLAEGQDLSLAKLDNRFQDGQIIGVAYLEAGIDEVMNRDASQPPWIIYSYEPSNVEFYSYKEPTVLRLFPTAGFTKGNTLVEILGIWFDYQPQYGIVPHCKFGNTVVRAHYDSTVRLVCASPAAKSVNAKLDFEISLNGVDWSDTNFTFAYYDEPEMTGLYPDMGSIEGGEYVYFMGSKFTNHTDPEYFKCRFTPQLLQLPPKETKVEFLNDTTIRCPAPGGWPEGDEMIVQITQNGIDWDDHHFVYNYYSIHRAFPRSGPSDGNTGPITVTGQGFRPQSNPKCRLNGTESDPISITKTEIKCKIPAAQAGSDYFGNVDFAITPNGYSWYPFDGGFQYYEQPLVEDIDPKLGPSQGVGIINFYGDNFRADYPLAQLGCKIGPTKGQAFYVSERQVKCIVDDMPLPNEDQDALPAQVSLNSYSYTKPTEKTMFRPYGIRQLSPNSGPVGGVTTVIVSGQGFTEEVGVTARCRFGSPANYAVVEAEILSYTRVACRTPDVQPLTNAAALPADVPFSVALTNDEFDPWTKTSHVFRFYDQPMLASAHPEQIEVGRISEVYVKAAEGSEFFEPMALQPNTEKGTNTISGGSTLSGMRCKFGRFGDAAAIYINETFIKCTTPPFDEGADTIYKEYAPISVAMNGVDYADDHSQVDFTFLGTAPYVSFVTIIILLAAIALFGYAVAMLIEQYNKRQAAADQAPA